MEEKASDEKTLKGLIERVRIELSDYVEIRLKLLKLEAYEKISIIGSYAVFGLIVAFIFLLITIFLLATLAILITAATHSLIIGFASVTGLIILVLLILLITGESIRKKMTNFILSIVTKLDKDE